MPSRAISVSFMIFVASGGGLLAALQIVGEDVPSYLPGLIQVLLWVAIISFSVFVAASAIEFVSWARHRSGRTLTLDIRNGGDFDIGDVDMDFDWSVSWLQLQQRKVKGYEGPPPKGAIHQFKLGLIQNHTGQTIRNCRVQITSSSPFIVSAQLPLDLEWLGRGASKLPKPEGTECDLAPDERWWIVLNHTTFNVAGPGVRSAKMAIGGIFGNERIDVSLRVLGEDVSPSPAYNYSVVPEGDGMRGHVRFNRITLRVSAARKLSAIWNAIRRSTPDTSGGPQ